jgi:Family of unknown function (DUF6221)
MSDIRAFLTARLDEDEARARAAQKKRRGPWWSFRFLVNNARPGKKGVVTPTARDRGSVAQAISPAVAIHIARHDPARVLRDVAAKRKILADYEKLLGERKSHPGDLAQAGALLALLGVIRGLAAVDSDHPDFRQEWA